MKSRAVFYASARKKFQAQAGDGGAAPSLLRATDAGCSCLTTRCKRNEMRRNFSKRLPPGDVSEGGMIHFRFESRRAWKI
jgi:hypothetical protein